MGYQSGVYSPRQSYKATGNHRQPRFSQSFLDGSFTITTKLKKETDQFGEVIAVVRARVDRLLRRRGRIVECLPGAYGGGILTGRERVRLVADKFFVESLFVHCSIRGSLHLPRVKSFASRCCQRTSSPRHSQPEFSSRVRTSP